MSQARLVTKQQLSPARQRILQLMQKFSFCSIRDLQIRGGDPTFSPPPTIIQDLKLGSDNDPRPQLYMRDFQLKAEHLELFTVMDEVQNGCIEEICVKYGLPWRLSVKRAV